jgi:putative serine protease PepD
MGPDDADDADDAARRDDPGAGPPPDPLDRPWVHPTELRSFVATPEAPPTAPRPREWVIGLTSAVAAVVATVLILSAFGAIGGRNRSPIRPPVVTTPDEVLDFSYAVRVYQTSSPSIVTVQAKVGDTTASISGVAIKSDRVLTAAHPLGGASAVTVITAPEGRSLTAKVVGTDPDTDLALLEVPGADLTIAQLATGSEPSVGQAVVAIGGGRGGTPFVGMNIVEARNAIMATPWGATLAGLIQTGVATPPDTMGGALLDTTGRVVGILVTVPGSPQAGLAVPVAMARDVQIQLDATGKVQRGWLGVDGEDATDRPEGGARIVSVVQGSPAEKAGLKLGDVVTRVGSLPIRTYGDLVAEWRRRHPGDNLTITFFTGSQAHNNVPVPLAATPDAAPPSP